MREKAPGTIFLMRQRFFDKMTVISNFTKFHRIFTTNVCTIRNLMYNKGVEKK